LVQFLLRVLYTHNNKITTTQTTQNTHSTFKPQLLSTHSIPLHTQQSTPMSHSHTNNKYYNIHNTDKPHLITHQHNQQNNTHTYFQSFHQL
jgi:hypothetical protein